MKIYDFLIIGILYNVSRVILRVEYNAKNKMYVLL